MNLQATPQTSMRLATIGPWNSISGSNLQLNASRTLVRTVPPPSNLSFDDTCRNFRDIEHGQHARPPQLFDCRRDVYSSLWLSHLIIACCNFFIVYLSLFSLT